MKARGLVRLVLLICICLSTFGHTQAASRREKRKAEKQWHVRHFSISGNESFSSYRIRSSGLLMATAPFNRPVFSPSGLRRDTALIARFYRANGYLNTQVRIDTVARDSSRMRVAIKLSVTEGARSFISKVTVGDTAQWADEDVRKLVTVQPGMPMLASAIIRDIRAIDSWLGKRGYLDALVDCPISLSSDSLSAAITFIYRPGAHIRVSSVELTGTKKVRPRVILRELRFKEDDVLTQTDLRRSVNNLYAADLFSFVSISYDSIAAIAPNDDSSRVLRVTVREKKFFNAEFGIGYQTYEKARGRVMVSYDNFFGTGVTGFGTGLLSFINQGIETGGRIPWLFGLPWDLETRFSMERRDEDRINLEGLFTEINTGLTWRWSPQLRTSLRHRLVNRSLIRAPVDDSTGEKITHSLIGEITFDSRDNMFEPKKGVYSALGAEMSGLSGTRSNQFVILTGEVRAFWALGEKTVLSSALRTALGAPYGESPSLPAEERFFLGGSNVMRGFAEKSLGPRDSTGRPTGGTMSLAWNVLELRYPIYGWFSGTVFFDLGNLWDLHYSSTESMSAALSGFSFRYNAGVGLRLHLPVVIIASDVGFKLDRRSGENLAAFQLNLGHAF